MAGQISDKSTTKREHWDKLKDILHCDITISVTPIVNEYPDNRKPTET